MIYSTNIYHDLLFPPFWDDQVSSILLYATVLTCLVIVLLNHIWSLLFSLFVMVSIHPELLLCTCLWLCSIYLGLLCIVHIISNFVLHLPVTALCMCYYWLSACGVQIEQPYNSVCLMISKNVIVSLFVIISFDYLVSQVSFSYYRCTADMSCISCYDASTFSYIYFMQLALLVCLTMLHSCTIGPWSTVSMMYCYCRSSRYDNRFSESIFLFTYVCFNVFVMQYGT